MSRTRTARPRGPGGSVFLEEAADAGEEEAGISVIAMLFDCAAGTAGVQAADDYDGQGNFIASESYDGNMYPLSDGTLQAYAHAIACAAQGGGE